MATPLTAAEIIQALGLVPHPTCGFVNQSFRSAIELPTQSLPPNFAQTHDGSARVLGDAMYFLVSPDVTMRLHRIRSDQTYHHYLGEPLDVLLFRPDGRFEVHVVGSDLAAGMRPQLLIPADTFHVSRLHRGSGFSLLATTVWISVDQVDVEQGDPQALAAAYPGSEPELRRFASW